jgi:CHAT domain-containing protein
MNDSPQSGPLPLPSPQESTADRIQLLKEAGDLDGALVLYKEAERTYRDSGNLTELKENLKSQGDLLLDRRDWVGSMRFLLEAEKICRELGDSARLQAVLNNLGLSLEMGGDLDGAARHFQESENICRDLRDLDGQCRCLFNRARVLIERGDLETALALYQKEEQIRRGEENLHGLQLCLARQAVIFKKQNNSDRALDLYREQEQILRQLGKLKALQRCIGKQAEIQKNLNQLDSALSLYKEQEQICRQLADREGLLSCLGDQTCILADLYDLSGALALCNEQEQLCRELEDPATLHLCLRNHAIILRNLNEGTSALALYKEQEQICRQLGECNSLLTCLGDQSTILEEQNDLDGAAALYAEQEQLCRQLEDSDRLRQCLKTHALLSKKRNDPVTALALFKEEEQICRRRDDSENLHVCLGNQALLLKTDRNLDGALALLKEKERLCRTLGNLKSLRWSLKNQALILGESNNLEPALAFYREEESVCRQLGDQDNLQVCLGNQALVLEKRGDLDNAAFSYAQQEQICRQAGNQRSLRWALRRHALILERRNDLDNALALCKEEEQICRELGGLNDVEVSLGTQASILEKRNDMGAALALYKQQEQICRQLANPDHLQRCLGNVAFIQRKRNHLDDALVALREKNQICREIGRTTGLVWALGQEATILKTQGDLNGAFALFKEQEQVCRELGELNDVAISLGNQASILEKQNGLDEALILYRQQAEICRQLNDTDRLQWCLGNQALILGKRDDLDGALALHKEEERLCRRLGKLDDLQVAIGNQALILKRLGDTDGALELFREKGEICRRLGKLGSVQWSLRNQALILEHRNELGDALVLFKEEERICRQLNKPSLLSASLDSQARILKARKELNVAFVHNMGTVPDSGKVSDISEVGHPTVASRRGVAASIRPLWVAVLYLITILVAIPTCMTLVSLLMAVFPLLLLWLLADRCWRRFRTAWRIMNTRRFRRIVTDLTSEVMSNTRTISSASSWISERSLRYVSAHYLVTSLITTVHAMRSANQGEGAVIGCRLVLALADKHGAKEDKKKCRRLLVECLSSTEVAPEIREDCEAYLDEDRRRSPQLFAASQIQRAQVLAKLATDPDHLQEIETLQSVESSLTSHDDIEQWVDAKNLLSVAFWRRWQAATNPVDLDLAIKHASACLEVLDDNDQPARWALAHYNLGVFYAARTSECPQDDIELTIESMECALRVYAPGSSNYVNAQMRLMAALSRRSKGIETLNLDRGIICINAAFTDPALTDAQRSSLETSLAVLMQRRWGTFVSSLVEARHIEATKQLTDNLPNIPILALRAIVGSGEPFERKRRMLAGMKYLTLLLDVVLTYALWHKPWSLAVSLVLVNVASICVAASLATEALEKVTTLPFDFFRVTPAFCWWLMTSKDPNKLRMIGLLMSFRSDPDLATRRLEEMWRAIHKDRNSTVWAVVGSIYAWLSLLFPQGERGESTQNAIAILEEAGTIFTEKHFGAFQAGVDFSLAKAYMLSAHTGRQKDLQRAIDLLTTHVMPSRLIGSRRRHGFIWAVGLQLLGDAYMMSVGNGTPHSAKQAIQCYVESLGSRSSSRLFSSAVSREVSSMAHMNKPTRSMRAHALKGVGDGLLSLADDQHFDRRALAIACLVNAYSVLDRPGIVRQIGAFVPRKETPSDPFESLRIAEGKLEVLLLTARALALKGPDSDVQTELAEAVLRVCASSALRSGLNEIGYAALMELGALLSREARLAEAVSVYDLAIRQIEASRTVARLIERRAEISRYSTEPFDRIITALVRLGRLNDACGYMERGKSLGISDLVALGRALKGGHPEPTAQEFTKLQLKATLLSQELAHIEESPGKTRTTGGAWKRKYITAQRQQFYDTTEKLLQLMASASQSRVAPSFEAKTLGTDAIQELARATKAAFVFFRVAEEATYAFILTPGRHRIVRSDQLSRSELDKALGLSGSSKPNRWWFRMGDQKLPVNWRDELDELLPKLGDVIMKKVTMVLQEQKEIEGDQSFNHVVLFPSRTLSILPLHACGWKVGGEMQCLLDAFPVKFSPSISIYKHCIERSRALTERTRFSGVFNPSGDLKFASWEYFQMRPVVEGWDGERLLRGGATLEAVRKLGPRSNVLHFSCHGEYRLDAPFRSRLILAGGNNLTLQQIVQEVRLDEAQLVVLSACESGLVDPRDAADEHYGLPTAFIFAGAPTVWATLWSVDDVATALLTVRAYENLRRGDLDKAEALRSAQLWLRHATGAELAGLLSRRCEGRDEDPSAYSRVMEKRDEYAGCDQNRPFENPYYWAAFHTVGA